MHTRLTGVSKMTRVCLGCLCGPVMEGPVHTWDLASASAPRAPEHEKSGVENGWLDGKNA